MKLSKVDKKNPLDVDYIFWCLGCKCYHAFTTARSPENIKFYEENYKRPAPIWTFNGDMEKPTFKPSLIYTRYSAEKFGGTKICHLFLTDGKLQYLSDCTHDYKNQTIDIPEEP